MTSDTVAPATLLLANPAPFLFFTGKGGVGKTTLGEATLPAVVAREAASRRVSAFDDCW